MKAGHGNYYSAANRRARRSYCGAEMLSVMTLQSAGEVNRRAPTEFGGPL